MSQPQGNLAHCLEVRKKLLCEKFAVLRENAHASNRRYSLTGPVDLVSLPFCWRLCFPKHLDDPGKGQKLGGELLSWRNLHRSLRAFCTLLATSQRRPLRHALCRRSLEGSL